MSSDHENPVSPSSAASSPREGAGLPLSRKEFIGAVGGAAAGALMAGSGATVAAETLKAATAVRPSAQKTIIQAMGLDIDQLDPHYFKSIPGYYAVCNLYDMMVDYRHVRQADGGLYPAATSSGDWEYTPWLAQSWHVSADARTMTFTLRKDLKFSDGTPLTAKDVKASWDRAVTGQGYAALVMTLMTITSPAQIVVPDDYTVVLHLKRPNPFAMKMLAVNVESIMSAKSLRDHATRTDSTAHNWFKIHAFGSAPYVLANWTPGVQWELRPNPNSWNPGVLKNAGSIIRTIPSAVERYNLLVRGDVDVAYDLQPKDLAALRHNPSVRLIQFKVPWPYYLGMNNTIHPFDNVKVRQAVSYAIPYKTIIDKVLYGFGQVCKSPVARGMPTSDFRFSPYNSNPAKTKQLLQQAGVSHLAFDLAVLQGRPQDAQIAVWIQASLAQAGVRVNILQMTDAEYYAKFDKRQLQAFIGEWYSWVNDPFYHLYWNFLSTNTFTNATGYSNPTVDKLIHAGLYETDTATRNRLSREAQRIIMHDAPWALLYQINYTIAVRSNIHGFNWYPGVGTRFWKVSKT